MCLFTSALRASVNKSHIPSLPQNNLYLSVITATYQCFGAQSSISRNPGFHKESEVTTGSSPHRQHHSGGIYQQEGGAHSPSLSTIVLEFWSHVLKIRSWVTATHIPGILNVDADMASRQPEGGMDIGLPDISEDSRPVLSPGGRPVCIKVNPPGRELCSFVAYTKFVVYRRFCFRNVQSKKAFRYFERRDCLHQATTEMVGREV
jgi:hypothetical protein